MESRNLDKKALLKAMGQRYYDRRRVMNYTQEEAAEIADVSQQAISNAELGKTFLAPDAMLKLCIAYGISCDYLLTGETSDKDAMIIDGRIRNLTSDQFLHYQAITEHFLAVATQVDCYNNFDNK